MVLLDSRSYKPLTRDPNRKEVWWIAYLQSLTNTENNTKTTVNSSLDLLGNEFVRLLQDNTALAVSNESPVDLEILELLDADFTGESAVGLVEDVLGSDADVVVGDLAGERQVGSGRGDDDLGVGVELGRVEVVDDGGDAVGNTVPIVCQYNALWSGVL